MYGLYLKIISLFRKYYTISGYDIRDSLFNEILNEFGLKEKCELASSYKIKESYGYQFVWNNTEYDFSGLKPKSFGIWYDQHLIKQFTIYFRGDNEIRLKEVTKIKKWFDRRFSTLFQRITKSPLYLGLTIIMIQVLTSFSAELGKYLFNLFFG